MKIIDLCLNVFFSISPVHDCMNCFELLLHTHTLSFVRCAFKILMNDTILIVWEIESHNTGMPACHGFGPRLDCIA